MAEKVELEAVRARAELLRYRASLLDPQTALPTLPLVLDRARKALDDRGSMQVLILRIEQEQLLEGVVGWELYDSFVMEVAAFLKLALADKEGEGSILCQEYVRSDTFVVFTGDAVQAERLCQLAARGVPVSADNSVGLTKLPLRVGRGRVWRRPAMRTERCIYGGVIEARRDFHRRGAMLDESRHKELRTILDTRSVRTLFQPIMRLTSRSVEGYEALSRGPQGSYLEPAENLFGFTERAGLLGEVEQLCVEQALSNASGLGRGAMLFINLSIHGLEYLETEGGGLAPMVQRSGWPVSEFVLELTERTYAENPQKLQDRAEALREYGFRFAIDDMGTGYSSLNVLADLQPEFIKLDHMLVRDLGSKPIKRNLVAAISDFARSSRSQVIAEGVETQEEAEVLGELGIDLVQGYLFGMPAAAPAATV